EGADPGRLRSGPGGADDHRSRRPRPPWRLGRSGRRRIGRGRADDLRGESRAGGRLRRPDERGATRARLCDAARLDRPMRTLTLRELNRATLARQLLLRRARLSVPRAVEQIAGIQAQDIPAAPLGLATRLERSDLDRALARGRVVKATLMRGTLHIVTAEDRELFLAALAPQLRKLGQRFGVPGSI